MKLKDVYKPEAFCLNLSAMTIESLTQFRVVEVNVNLDFRDPKFKQKLFARLSKVVQSGNTVYFVPTKFSYQTPVILTTIYGITKNLPSIIYFDKSKDPKLTNPLVEDLEFIRWMSQVAGSKGEKFYELVHNL